MFDHPAHVVAVHAVHHPDHVDRAQSIWVLGAFSIARDGCGRVRFSRHHFVYPPDGHCAHPPSDVQALLAPGSLLIGCIDADTNRYDFHAAEEQPCVFDRTKFSITPPRHMLLEVPGDDLNAIAADYGLPAIAADAPLAEQARSAPDRAQAIWLTWLWHYTQDPQTRRDLAAAFKLWRAREDALPLVS